MNRLDEMRSLLQKTSFKSQQVNFKLYFTFFFIGLVAFLGSLFLSDPGYAWQGLLVNTLFFAGIAQAGLAFSVIATVSDALWLRPIKRVAEGLSFFGVFSVVLFIILFFGAGYLFEWFGHSEIAYTKSGWLNAPFFIIRQLLGFLVIGLLSFFYLKHSLRPDLGLAAILKVPFQSKLAKFFASNYQDHEVEAENSYRINKYVAPWLGFTFAVVTSLVAFDWMMSLDYLWFSTMFGVQYMVSSLIGAGAVLIIISGFMQTKMGLQDYQTVFRHHDITKLTFAFTLLWCYMIFAQVLVIWYADIPEETPFMILRMQSTQWGWMYWVIFFMLFIIPFFGLMSRTACRSVIFSRIIAIDILIGLWLEKYFIVIPSIQENHLGHHAAKDALIPGFEWLPFAVCVLIGLGVLGIFLYSFSKFLINFPGLPIADNRLIKSDH